MLKLDGYSGLKICVAVSGGKDSMALLHYLNAHAAEYGITLSALNCDHKIRGEASERDSAFVKEWCASKKIPLLFFEADKNSVPANENVARMWRLKCYVAATRNYNRAALSSRTCDEPVAVYSANGEWRGVDAVATAHHLNDNAETVLFNLARGSALSGMEGITDCLFPADGNKCFKLIHPMLALSCGEIENYVKENGVPYVQDESNFSDDYTRNKIRHNVLPELEKAVPGAAKAIYRFSRLAAEDEEYFDRLIKERKLIKGTRLGFEIAFCKEAVVFKRAAVKALAGLNTKDYTSEHAKRLYELQFAENGKKFEFLGFTAFKENGKIAVCDSHMLQSEKQGMPFKEHLACEYSFWNDTFIHISYGDDLQENLLAFEAAAQDDTRIPKKLKVLKCDGAKIPQTAIIRFMKAGDKFTKFGGGSKNLGDYYTDKKLSVRVRKQIPVIADGNEILAVGGVEISDKIKITENTKTILYIICAEGAAL